MPRRLSAALLIVSLLSFLILFFGSFFAESIAYIGIYEFFSSFSQFVERTWMGLFLASVVFSIIRIFFYEGYFLSGLSGLGVRPWFFAFILGFLEPPFSFSVVSRMTSLYRSGVHAGTLVIYSIASIFFSLPLLVILSTIWSFDVLKWYGILGGMACIFLGASAEILAHFGIMKPMVLTRGNPDKVVKLFSFSYIRSLGIKGYLSLGIIRLFEFWKYSFPSWVFGIIALSLIQAAFSHEVLHIFLGGQILGPIGIFFLTMVLPFYGIASIPLGTYAVDIYSALGTCMTLFMASFFWKYVFDVASYKLFEKSWKLSFLLLLFIGILLLGYLANLLGS